MSDDKKKQDAIPEKSIANNITDFVTDNPLLFASIAGAASCGAKWSAEYFKEFIENAGFISRLKELVSATSNFVVYELESELSLSRASFFKIEPEQVLTSEAFLSGFMKMIDQGVQADIRAVSQSAILHGISPVISLTDKGWGSLITNVEGGLVSFFDVRTRVHYSLNSLELGIRTYGINQASCTMGRELQAAARDLILDNKITKNEALMEYTANLFTTEVIYHFNAQGLPEKFPISGPYDTLFKGLGYTLTVIHYATIGLYAGTSIYNIFKWIDSDKDATANDQLLRDLGDTGLFVLGWLMPLPMTFAVTVAYEGVKMLHLDHANHYTCELTYAVGNIIDSAASLVDAKFPVDSCSSHYHITSVDTGPLIGGFGVGQEDL